MPAKFKPSEKQYIRNKDGRATNRWQWKHYYCKNTSTEDLIEAINKGKRKHRNKFINELTRRGVKLVWKTPEELAEDT
tara:strand:- start:526 stop:759 length:234 start_codon:yes stop_codon:yes gene_type:complete